LTANKNQLTSVHILYFDPILTAKTGHLDTVY